MSQYGGKDIMHGEWLRQPASGTSVVFVHGILSSGETCWQNENGNYWPELLKADKNLESLGIYIFTYQTDIFSGNYRIGDIVDALKEQMGLDKVLESNQIVFVCHSMGGIVVRKFLVERAVDLIERKISIGLFLVASPSLGSSYANWLFYLAQPLGHRQAEALRFTQSNAWLNDLDKEFQNLKESRKLNILGKELIEDKFISLGPNQLDTKKISFWNLPKRLIFLIWSNKLLRSLLEFFRSQATQVVEPFSAARYFGDPIKVPTSDHSSIAKPDDARALQHRLLCKFITDLIEKEKFALRHKEPTMLKGSQLTFLQLCKKIAPLLTENRDIYRNFGPNSGADAVGQVRWDLTLWETSKREIIIPNNKEITALIKMHNDLIPTRHKVIFDKMLKHSYAFEKHCETPTFDYREHQFPKEFSEIVFDECFRAALKDEQVLNIRDWLIENITDSSIPVIDGCLIGSALLCISANSDIDITLLLADQSTSEIQSSNVKLESLKDRFHLKFCKPLHITTFTADERDVYSNFVEAVNPKYFFDELRKHYE